MLKFERSLQSESFERDGVVLVRSAISPEWVARLQDATADAMATPPKHANRYGAKDGEAAFYSEVGIYRRHPVFREFALEGPLRSIAAEILRSRKLNIFGDQLLVKEPGTSTPTPWHHDLPYWRVRGSQIISMWVALDVVGADNGGVEYVRGSHRTEKLYRPEEFGEDTRFKNMTLDRVPDIDANRAAFDIVSYEMQPGDAIAFAARTLHGSPANASTRYRRALSVRYTGDDVVFHELPGMPPSQTPTGGLQPGDVLDSEAYPLVWKG